MRIGPYEVLGEIGRGAAGVVYRALDPQGVEVALKLLAARPGNEGSQRRRFDREARVLAKVSHPAIVGIRDTGDHHGEPYLVMDLLTGRSLQDQLDADGPLQPGRAAEILHELALALGHAHELGVLHRDLKPANVVLTVQGKPKLTDFGLAKDLDASLSTAGRLSVDGQFLGTPGYWAPEQASGQPDALGPHTDVYGLGALLYGLLTARPPHLGGSLHELAIAAREQRVAPPSELEPKVDSALDAICLRCMEKSPSDRYPSVEAVAEALDRYLNGGVEVEGRSAGAALLLVAVPLVLVAVAGSAWVAVSREEPAPPTIEPTSSPSPSAPAPPSVDPRVAAHEHFVEARRASQAHDFARALGEIERAIEIDPTYLGARLRRADVIGRTDRVAGLREFERLQKLHPEQPEVYVQRGAFYANEGDFEPASRDFERALLLDPDFNDALSHRAVLRMKTNGDRLESLADLDRVLADDPDHLHALVIRGGILMELSRAEEALVDLDRALAIDPLIPTAYTNRGAARLRSGDAHGAIRDLNRALELNPEDATAHVNRGGARQSLDDIDGAEADFRKAVELMPENPFPHYNLGALHGMKAEWRQALAEFTRALELRPHDAETHGDRGRVWVELGDDSAAIEDYRRALELDPQHRFARKWRLSLREAEARAR